MNLENLSTERSKGWSINVLESPRIIYFPSKSFSLAKEDNWNERNIGAYHRGDRLSQAWLILSCQFTAEFAAFGRGIVGSRDALTGFQSVSQANAPGTFLQAMRQTDKVSAYYWNKPLNTR